MRQIVDRLQESEFKVSEQGQRLIRAEIALAQAEVKAKAQQAVLEGDSGATAAAGAAGGGSLLTSFGWAVSSLGLGGSKKVRCIPHTPIHVQACKWGVVQPPSGLISSPLCPVYF